MTQPASGMHAEDIKAAIRKRYGSLGALAARWEMHETIISRVLRDPLASIRTEQRIAEALNTTPRRLWPNRWSADGSPLPYSDRGQATTKTGFHRRQKACAA